MKKTSIKGGGGRRRAAYHKMNNNNKLDPIHKPNLKGGKISSKQSKNNKTREIYVWKRVLLHKLRWSKSAAKNKTRTQMEICKERYNTNDGCFCLGCSTETHTERHKPDRQRGKEMRKMQWKSRKARGSREKRETRSVHEQVEQHLQ